MGCFSFEVRNQERENMLELPISTDASKDDFVSEFKHNV